MAWEGWAKLAERERRLVMTDAEAMIALENENAWRKGQEQMDNVMDCVRERQWRDLLGRLDGDAEEIQKLEREALERRGAAFDAMHNVGAIENLLKWLRDAGWRVAVHNDYETNGHQMTFWLFTHPKGEYVKGEASTDLGALRICAIKAESFAKGW